MALRKQPPRPTPTQDEQVVLKNLLVGTDHHIDGKALFTCGGHTASASEWQAVGVLSDLVLARKTPRMNPGMFELRLLSMSTRGLAQPSVQEILGAAWLVAADNAKAGVTDLAMNKQREHALSEILRVSVGNGGGEKAYATIASGLCDDGLARVAGALGGIARATQRRGTGGRVWRVWHTLVETLLSPRTPGTCTWKCLASLCGRLLAVEEQSLRPMGLPWRTPPGEPSTSWREKVARCVAHVEQPGANPPSAQGWFNIIRMIVPVAGASVRKMPNTIDLTLAVDTLVQIGATMAPGFAAGVDAKKVEPDLMALAANPAAGDARTGAAGLVALLQQSRLGPGADARPLPGRARRRA